MKVITSLLFLSIGIHGMSQKTEAYPEYDFAYSAPKSISITQKVITNEDAARVIKQQFNLNTQEDIILLNEIESPFGKHYTFIQTYYGYEIFNAHIKINTDLNGTVLSNYSSRTEIYVSQHPALSQDYLQQAASHIESQIQESKLIWYPLGNKYQLVSSFKCLDHSGNYFQILLDEGFQELKKLDLLNYQNEIDTTAKAFVHAPNPLTSAMTEYGGNYVDNNDANSPYLDSQRDTVDIHINYINNTFVLENDYVKIVETSFPNVPPVQSTTPFFYYNRSQSGFEDVNVIYHITKQQAYLQELGFTNLVNYQIAIDCHGLNGADNSLFNYGTNPPSIIFGEGGVDDAEDADVIIHEYTHAIMESASPNTNFGSERGSMDEAFGDYLAASYSITYTNYHDNWVFKWDGHNEYWEGREVVSNKQYPDDLQYSKYADAPMWSAALMQIERNLGRDITTTIALEAAYSYTTNMEMWQAASLFLVTDSLINNGENKNTICWVFRDRGMIDTCPSSKPPHFVGVENVNKSPTIKLTNSHNFSLGKENLIVHSTSTFRVDIYDLMGKLIYTVKGQHNQLEIKPEDINTHSLVIKVSNLEEVKTFKMVMAN